MFDVEFNISDKNLTKKVAEKLKDVLWLKCFKN